MQSEFVNSDNIQITVKIYALSIEILAECHCLWRYCVITIKPGTNARYIYGTTTDEQDSLRLCYGLDHAHKPPRFISKILNSVKLPW